MPRTLQIVLKQIEYEFILLPPVDFCVGEDTCLLLTATRDILLFQLEVWSWVHSELRLKVTKPLDTVSSLPGRILADGWTDSRILPLPSLYLVLEEQPALGTQSCAPTITTLSWLKVTVPSEGFLQRSLRLWPALQSPIPTYLSNLRSYHHLSKWIYLDFLDMSIFLYSF